MDFTVSSIFCDCITYGAHLGGGTSECPGPLVCCLPGFNFFLDSFPLRLTPRCISVAMFLLTWSSSLLSFHLCPYS